MADVDSKSMDDIEEKKWLISRIDLFHKSLIDGLLNDVSKYENEAEKALSTLRRRRGYALSVIGVILTILLGIIRVEPVEQWILILAILGTVSLAITIIFNWLIGFVEKFSGLFNDVYVENIGRLAASHGFIITSVALISKVTFQFVLNYHVFTMLLTSAIMISIAKSLRRLAKDFSRSPQIKSALLDEAKIYEKQKEFIPLYYQNLDRTQKVVPELMEFVDKTLEDYRNKK